MQEHLDIYAELRSIRDRLDGIEQRQEVQIRAQKDEILASILGRMESDLTLARVYLEIDGSKTQDDILGSLLESGFNITQGTVSKKIRILFREMGVIELVDHDARGKVYRHGVVDRILDVSRKVSLQVTSIQTAQAGSDS